MKPLGLRLGILTTVSTLALVGGGDSAAGAEVDIYTPSPEMVATPYTNPSRTTIYGIRAFGSGAVMGGITNRGVIESTRAPLLRGANGIILTAGIDVSAALRPGNITNAGTISFDRGRAPVTFGIVVSGTVYNSRVPHIIPDFVSGSVINSGLILADASTRAAGIMAVYSNINGNIVNSGTITAPGADGVGIVVNGSTIAGSIRNAGIIAGSRAAIDLSLNGAGTATTINQLGGTIAGDILLSDRGDIINITGGAIVGNITGNTASSGAKAGTVNFNLATSAGPGGASGSQSSGNATSPPVFVTGGTMEVASINVNSGTVVLANDVTTFDALTNSGILQLNNTGLRTITGNFVQASGGTLAIEIGPSGSARLGVTKNATLAGTLALLYDPGVYTAKTYTLLQASSVSGNFSKVTGLVPSAGLSQTVTVNSEDVQLALTGVPAPMTSVPLAPTNDTAFAAMTSAMVENGQQAARMVLDRVDARLGGMDDAPPPARGREPPGPAANGNLATAGAVTAALPQSLTAAGAWGRGVGSFTSLNGSATAPGFSATSGGFLVGFDRPVMPGFYLGGAVGYLHGDVYEHSSSSGDIDTGRVLTYGGGWAGPALWAATVGYAHDGVHTSRGFAGLGTATEGHGGSEVGAAGEWALPLTLPTFLGSTRVTPKTGLAFLHLHEDGFGESDAGGLDLSSGARNTDSLRPYIGVGAAWAFTAAGDTRLTPELHLGYSREVLSNTRALTVTTVDGSGFRVEGVRPSRNIVSAGGGIVVSVRQNISFCAGYDVGVGAGSTTSETVSAALHVGF